MDEEQAADVLELKSDDKFFGIDGKSLHQGDFPELWPLLKERAKAQGTTPAQVLEAWPSVTVDASQYGSIARC